MSAQDYLEGKHAPEIPPQDPFAYPVRKIQLAPERPSFNEPAGRCIRYVKQPTLRSLYQQIEAWPLQGNHFSTGYWHHTVMVAALQARLTYDELFYSGKLSGMMPEWWHWTGHTWTRGDPTAFELMDLYTPRLALMVIGLGERNWERTYARNRVAYVVSGDQYRIHCPGCANTHWLPREVVNRCCFIVCSGLKKTWAITAWGDVEWVIKERDYRPLQTTTRMRLLLDDEETIQRCAARKSHPSPRSQLVHTGRFSRMAGSG